MDVQVLTVSSKGQIALPANIRKTMSIEKGDKLVVYTSGDVIMMKVLRLPSAEEIKRKMDEAQAWAASVGYTEEDVTSLIKETRAKKHE